MTWYHDVEEEQGEQVMAMRAWTWERLRAVKDPGIRRTEPEPRLTMTNREYAASYLGYTLSVIPAWDLSKALVRCGLTLPDPGSVGHEEDAAQHETFCGLLEGFLKEDCLL